MSTITQLETQAITAAKSLDWSSAITHNTAILENHPQNVNALNRLGFAYFQSGNLDQAKATYLQVLNLEPSNPIAAKQLDNIKNRRLPDVGFAAATFVEEPSKSKIVELHRLAHKQILETLTVGQELKLIPKNRFISLTTLEKTYIGSLPEDISLHLSFLIDRGNQYSCHLHSVSSKHCTVFIKETFQSPENQHYHSFVSNYIPNKEETIGDELLLLADESPLSILDDDSDSSDTAAPHVTDEKQG